MILTFPSLPFLFPCINTPLSCHTGQNMHTACYVCMCWVATLSFFLNKNFFCNKTLSQYYFSADSCLLDPEVSHHGKVGAGQKELGPAHVNADLHSLATWPRLWSWLSEPHGKSQWWSHLPRPGQWGEHTCGPVANVLESGNKQAHILHNKPNHRCYYPIYRWGNWGIK